MPLGSRIARSFSFPFEFIQGLYVLELCFLIFAAYKIQSNRICLCQSLDYLLLFCTEENSEISSQQKCLSAKTFQRYIKVRSAFILNQIPTNDPIVFLETWMNHFGALFLPCAPAACLYRKNICAKLLRERKIYRRYEILQR